MFSLRVEIVNYSLSKEYVLEELAKYIVIWKIILCSTDLLRFIFAVSDHLMSFVFFTY